MPTVVVMDVSLSMTRPVPVEGTEEFQRKHLAAHGPTMLFEHCYELQAGIHSLDSSTRSIRVVQQEWGASIPSQIVLVTDGCLGIGRGSLQHSLSTLNQRNDSNRFPLPFPFVSKLYIMCMANLEELQSSDSLDCLERLIDLNNGEGQIFTIDGPLCLKNVQSMFGELIDVAYTPFHAVLSGENLSSDVSDLEVVGFIDIADISSPPVLSRPLTNWHGMLYSQAQQKKSNLMMSLFEPGSEPLPDCQENPYGEEDNKSPFPLQPKSKRSYHKCDCMDKTKTDVQKILRNARSFQKKPTFYKAALAFGFLDLLKGVSDMLERECTLLPDTAHPDAASSSRMLQAQLKLASTGSSEHLLMITHIVLYNNFSGRSSDRI
ncbi:hypothetical protein GDO86_019914 [Hymenochirus boettgeri]|uniref:Integrator complex subunit 14 n=1 Tax=Hymenochirus boettgeri TaxID=247094 RepID=A0A8T2IG14_9PIPI|nr:hypothetical protein GDO86_019914 [Hymenochirus boettgeri]